MLDTASDLRAQLRDPSLIATKAYVAGQWIDADDGSTFAVTNPARGDVICEVPNLSRAEVARAIAAADTAMQGWKARTAKERANILRAWFNLMMENQDDLARILTAEMGKPFAEAKGEIAYGASFIEWFAEEAKRIYGETIPGHQPDKRITVLRQPIGVVASITPWNFPNAMITRKCGPALAAGCGFVGRPASETPLSALALAVLAERAGLPAGIFSVVTSKRSSEVGREMCENSKIRKLTFTGSTEVGRILLRQAADQVLKCSMELGGNAPFIVFDDADLDQAVAGAIMSKYRNNGQTCVCANRIYVQAGVYDAFAAKLGAAVAKLRVGDGLSETVELGPLVNMAAVEKVEEHIADAVAKGGKVVAGGKGTPAGGRSSNPRSSPASPSRWRSRRRKPSAPSRLFSASRPRPRRSAMPTTRSSASPPISTPATSGGSRACRRRWNTASSASTPASSRPRSRPLAASSNRGWAARGLATGSRTSSR